MLNEQQKAAVDFDGKHLLVLAGAGSGKTKTIIARAAHLIEEGVDPKKILIVSFTRKSAREIIERIKTELDGIDSDGVKGQTFHSWCMEIIKSNPNVFNMKSYTLIDEDDKESCFKLISGKLFKTDEDINFNIDFHDIIEVYSFALNTCSSLTDAMKFKLRQKCESVGADVDEFVMLAKDYYSKAIKAYIEFKKKNHFIDYDDILSIVANGLASNEEARRHIAKQWDYILVDEMQDTNPLQYKVLSMFYDDCHLFCVGDDAQSIYAFRGADFNAIHSFTEVVPDSQKQKLTVNYRSTQEILDLSNWVLKMSPLGYDKELTAANGHGKKPNLMVCDNEYDEANDVTDKIQSSRKEFGSKWKDNMVLSRSMFGLRLVEAQCIAKKIPYVVYGGVGLMQSRHVRDAVAPLRVVANPKDELAWLRFLMLWKNIGEVSASKIISNVMKDDDIDKCVARLKKENVPEEAKKLMKDIAGMSTDPSSALSKVLEHMGKRFKEKYKTEWEDRKKDIEVLRDVAKNNSSISDFVAAYVLDPKLETTLKNQEVNEDSVILSTIHSAKGLEAENVYVLRVNPYSFPSTRAMQSGPESIEEERRCLYVALTRAKEHLYVYTISKSMHTDSYNQSGKVTYFLDGLPDKLVDTVVVKKPNKNSFSRDSYNNSPIDIDKAFDFNFD